MSSLESTDQTLRPGASRGPWGSEDLPEPLSYSLPNLLRTIGPGAILLAGSIGGGEWLVGPAVAVQYGVDLFWLATVAIALQTVVNLEAIRYTLYTGEPIVSGIMRLRPGSRFWGAVYSLLTVAQLGLPALAAGCGSVLFASFAGRMPVATDAGTVNLLTYGTLLVAFLILLFGGTIERMLEYVSWGMIAYIFIFLLSVNLLFVPFSHWIRTWAGFFKFGHFTEEVDLLLLGALAATAGSGGIGNLAISNWVRDKGFGMGEKVGAIPSAFGSHQLKLSPTGKVFPLTPENLKRWRTWWKYVVVDQVWLWAVGCFVGMFLNINLATAIITAGTDIAQIGAGAYQAHYMAEHLWKGLWVLGLLNGFWILFSTHLGNTDMLIRVVTDVVWMANSEARGWTAATAAKIYYVLLSVFTVWALLAVNWGHAMDLFKVLGNVAGFVLAMAAIQVLIVSHKLLPKELQPGLLRKLLLVSTSIFYGLFSVGLLMKSL